MSKSIEIRPEDYPRLSRGQPAENCLEEARVQQERRNVRRGATQRRRNERLDLERNAKLRPALGKDVSGRIVNIAPSGCCLMVGKGSFHPGEQVWVMVEGLESWSGTVRWVENGKVGVEFDRLIYLSAAKQQIKHHTMASIRSIA